MGEHKRMIQRIREIMREHSKNISDEEIDQITEELIDEISENFRSITEVHSIAEGIRAGMNVQIAYMDPDEEPDPYVVKPCW